MRPSERARCCYPRSHGTVRMARSTSRTRPRGGPQRYPPPRAWERWQFLMRAGLCREFLSMAVNLLHRGVSPSRRRAWDLWRRPAGGQFQLCRKRDQRLRPAERGISRNYRHRSRLRSRTGRPFGPWTSVLAA